MATEDVMQNFVIGLLQTKLQSHFTYHNVGHTLYVTKMAIAIGHEENCTPGEIRLLKAAALWHDVGYLETYKKHEEASCDYARINLPTYGFSAREIDIICGIIMATKIPQSPKDKLGAILADADLAYLGTEAALALAENLYQELLHPHPLLTRNQWNHRQIAFLQSHQYFTNYCRRVNDPQKQTYLKLLISLAT